MDSIKDIQQRDYLAKFLDNYVVKTNPFGRNASGDRAYRRAERLVAALHVLTNHVPPQEPSRAELRQVGVALLSNLLALRDEMRVSVSPAFRAVQASIRELISLVRVLSISGYVSFQNASTVIEALDELGNFLTASQRSTLSESVTFSKEDLMDVRGSEGKTSQQKPQRREQRKNKEAGALGAESPEEKKKQVSLERRAEAILDILKNQGVIGIRDVAAHLPEYSEKMVQRELANLVSLGRVKKMGFKRWSKYEFVR